ncbi:MAG: HDOD domain-containing protein [Methylococcaceae bacterium]|nr:HDOD domain-containing protein [Methylococcaceae bacterium]
MQASLINWTLSTIDSQVGVFVPPVDMRQKINQIKALPPLPAIAQKILQLGADPLADARKLGALIEQDPLLTAQVIRWASSSFYGYRGKISSVEDAISRVLGFDFVFNLALGLASLAPLKSPKEGQIGTKMFWTHALASTHLMKVLSERIHAAHRPEAQQIFLAALLHNIGFPLMGDQFPEEFSFLNTLIKSNPSLSVFNLENYAFGVDHTMLGVWLMTTWSMPKPLTDIVYHHHNPFYRGDNYQLNLLTFLNDYLLGLLGIGDAQNQACPDEVFTGLYVTRASLDDILDKLNDKIESISATAEMLAL